MRPFILAAAAVLAASPLLAQADITAKPEAATRPAPDAPKPTKVVAKSGRLVTARTAGGGTRSYNCRQRANRNLKICKG